MREERGWVSGIGKRGVGVGGKGQGAGGRGHLSCEASHTSPRLTLPPAAPLLPLPTSFPPACVPCLQLPASFFAYRKQQHRWTCGPIQLWSKASSDIWRSQVGRLSLSARVFAAASSCSSPLPSSSFSHSLHRLPLALLSVKWPAATTRHTRPPLPCNVCSCRCCASWS